MTSRSQSTPAKRRCPQCGAPSDRRTRPFCSRRCRDIDLARWLDGAYAIPVVEEDGAEDDFSSDEGR
jgi:endogenous inhibitor of DNA gyrase (YacG/DUF329 family)